MMGQPQDDWGPYEIHPYIHREAELFDTSRKILLWGTFPPRSYIANLTIELPPPFEGPQLDFYYGNTPNLWRFFIPGIDLNNPVLAVDAVREFIWNNNIAISDVIIGTQRNVFQSPEDRALYNICPNMRLCKLLTEESLVDTILTTSGSLKTLKINGNSQVNTLNLLLTILRHCKSDQHISISGLPNGNGPFYPLTLIGMDAATEDQQRHIVWYLKIGNRIFRIINLPTPASSLSIMGSALFLRWVNYKAVQSGLPAPDAHQQRNLKAYMNQHPEVFVMPFTNQYRNDIYNMAINNVELLINL
jgi:hypothetical protein